MNQLNCKLGDIYSINGIHHVLVHLKFEEYYNTGGYGIYHLKFINQTLLNELIASLNGKISDEILDRQSTKYKSTDFKDNSNITIKHVDGEIPYSINTETKIVHTVRRKQPKTVTLYV